MQYFSSVSSVIFLMIYLSACSLVPETQIIPRASDIKPIDLASEENTEIAGCYGHSQPYTIKGKQYWIRPVPVGYMEEGLASWYGHWFHGRKTASGEYFDMGALTAAHKTLPLFATVQVTNLHNGRKINVRINDRGPFIDDRIIDLSHSAAGMLGMLELGIVPVSVEVLTVPYRTPLEGPLIISANNS